MLKNYLKQLMIAFLMLTGYSGFSQVVQTLTTAGAGTWVCPMGVTSITVECWSGGGGGGGTGAAATYGGGGAGGSYSRSVLTVMPGTTYPIMIGSGGSAGSNSGGNGGNGGDTWFSTAATIFAQGGAGGTGGTSTTAAGVGGIGTVVNNVGTVQYRGGNGATGSSTRSGSGGGSAGSTAAGGDATATDGGAAGATGGVVGAAGRTSANDGRNGTGVPGSAASGGYRSGSTTYTGGTGSSGQITISYPGYCITNPTTVNTSDIITKVSITNAGTGNYTNTTTNASTGETNNYVAFNNTPIDLYVGTNCTIAITFGTDGTQWSAVWIDFNQNQIYEASENIALATSSAAGSATVTYTFSVPAGTMLGNTRLRVRGGADVTYTANGACTTSSFGETEDYIVNIANPPSCLPPATPSVSNITAYTANINFTASTSAPASGYDYYVSTINMAPTAGSTPSGNGNTIPLNAAGLSPVTTYYAWVRSRCSAADQSVWVSAGSFTTMVSCSPPTALSTANVTATSADINFTASITTPSNGYDYYTSTTNTAPTASTTPTGNVAGTTISITGNFTNASQYVWVRARCSSSDQSVWAGPVSVGYCTPSGTSTNTYISSFITTGGYLNISNANSGYSSTGYQNATSMTVSQSQSGVVNFSTTIVGGSAGTAVWVDWNDNLVFDDATEKMYTTSAYGNDVSGTITVPANAPLGNHRMRVLLDYNATAPSACTFASGRGEAEDYVFSVIPVPTCLAPSGLSLSNVTANSVNIVFTASSSNTANGYDYYVSTTNTAPIASTMPTGNGATSPVIISGLAPTTTYYVWLRTNCSVSDQSFWIAGPSFTTPCLATNVPYVQQFEGITPPAIPSCSSVENAGSGNLWATIANPANYGFVAADGQVLRYSYNSTYAANTWWYSQGINLIAGTSYYIVYKYGNDGGTTFPEKMKVAYGTGSSATNMTNLLANHTSITNATATRNTVYFTPPTSGVYYFGFNAYSAANQDNLYLDSIKVDVINCVPVASALTSSNLTSTGATVGFTAAVIAPGNGYDYYLSTTNTAPDGTTTPTGNVATNSISLSSLTPSTTYYVWVRSRCSTTDQSIWSSSVSFTTTAVNDLPSDAITVAVGAGCTGNPYTNLNATQATNEPFASCNGTAGFASVWYKFVAPASGAVKISCDGTSETIGNSKMALFNVGNPADFNTFTILSCDNDNGVLTANKSLFYYFGLTAGTTYYVNVDVTAASQTKGSFCLTVDEFSSSMLANTAADCQADQASVSSVPTAYHSWVSLVDANGNLIANIRGVTNSAAQTYASSLTVKNNPVLRADANGHSYMNRNFLITGTNTTSADVQLFFTNAELTAMGGNIATLNVTKVAGATCAANFVDGSGATQLLTQTANGSVGGVNYIQVNTPGFSNFYIMGGTTPLPITFEYFNGRKMDKTNRLDWKINNTEKGTVTMTLERSEDGKNFVAINEQKLTPESKNVFSYDDRLFKAGTNIYRIRLTNEDGKEMYSQTVTLINSNKGFEVMNIIPNPVKNQSVLKLLSAEGTKVNIVVSDIAGRVLVRQENNVLEGENIIPMDFSQLHAGTYQISVTNDSGNSKTLRFVKN